MAGAAIAGAYQDAPEYGPAKGTLVIVGGGGTDGTGIVEKFIELAGGPDKKFVIVPTAGGNRNDDGSVRSYEEAQIVGSWLKRGLKNVKMLHTHDPKVADTEEFVKESARRRRRLVQRRPPVEHRRLVREHADLTGVPQGARARRRHRRQLGRRDDPGGVPRARRHVGPERHDDRRSRTTRRASSSCAGPRSISTSTRATAGTT